MAKGRGLAEDLLRLMAMGIVLSVAAAMGLGMLLGAMIF